MANNKYREMKRVWWSDDHYALACIGEFSYGIVWELLVLFTGL